MRNQRNGSQVRKSPEYLALYRGKPNRAVGEKVAGAKLTREKVAEIRRRYQRRGITQRALAKEYGVDRNTIGLILRGETWRIQ